MPLDDSDPENAQSLVEERKAAGANFLKMYPLTFELAAAARRAGLPFGGHLSIYIYADNNHPQIPVMDASDGGMSIVDQVVSSGGLDTLCWAQVSTAERCQRLAERFRRNGTWLVPTLSRMCYEGLYTGSRSTTDSASTKCGASPQLAADSQAMAVMQRVGLPILAGTDVGGPGGGGERPIFRPYRARPYTERGSQQNPRRLSGRGGGSEGERRTRGSRRKANQGERRARGG